MPDTTTTDPIPNATEAATKQATDAVNAAMESARKLLEEAGQNTFQFAAYQASVAAMTLTLHNAVAEQQHAHILRMAATTAASNALLDGRKAEAEQLLAMARSNLAAPAITDLMDQIRKCIDSLNQGLRGDPPVAAKSTTKPAAKAKAAKPAAKAKAATS